MGACNLKAREILGTLDWEGEAREGTSGGDTTSDAKVTDEIDMACMHDQQISRGLAAPGRTVSF